MANLGFTIAMRDAGIEAVATAVGDRYVLEEMRRHFRPEFLNRIDEIVVFSHLAKEQLAHIIEIYAKKLNLLLKEKGLELELSPAAAELVCDLEPETSNSEGMAAALLPTMRGGRVLLVRADRGRDVMRRELESAGHDVTEVAAYTTQALPGLDAATAEAIDRGGIDWITVTSAAIADELGLSPKTVEGYRANLMQKLDVHNVPALVRFAVRVGLVPLDG